MDVANGGISLSMALNVRVPCLSTVLCTWPQVEIKIFTAFATLRVTATTSTKERCALGSQLVIVPDMAMLTATLAGTQFPGSSLKKYQKLRLRCQEKQTLLHKRL